MKMKLNSSSVLCLSLLLFHTHFSLAKKGGGGFGKSFGGKKFPTSNRGSTHTNSNVGHKHNQGSSSQGGYPRQPGQPNQGGHPPQSGSYPQQPGGGGHHNQHPRQGSPYGGGQGGYGYGHGGYGYGQGGYGYGQGGYGSHGSYGSYGGGYINHNPNNKILSPQYGGSFGYGGYGSRGGSPFSYSVQQMGMYPSDKSRGFGRSAVMAAAGGAVAGMALGYGLGRFPRPHFRFNSPQEEHYYNHYMYRKYGIKSTDTNDYSRDYQYSKPPDTYNSYMDSCIQRTDLLPEENRPPKDKPAAATATVITKSTTSVTTTTTATPDTNVGNNPTESSSSSSNAARNSTAAGTSSTSAPSTPHPLNQPEAKPEPPASQGDRKTAVGNDDDDDTVSIVEIGYPALIKQLKVRRCLELYMAYSEKYLKRKTEPNATGGVQRLEVGLRGLLAVITSTMLMLLNNNMLMLLH